MAKARVELIGSLTHTAKNRTFKKGEPQILTDGAEIEYYKGQPEFGVTELREVKPKAAAAPPPPPEEDDEEEVEDAPVKHTAESLSKMSKADLITEASGPPFNLALSPEMKKADMIAEMLQALDGDEGDDSDDTD